MSMPSSSEAVATSTLNLAGLQLSLRLEAKFPRQTSVMGGHGVGPKSLRQVMCHPLGQAARVHKHQRRAVLLTSSAMRS